VLEVGGYWLIDIGGGSIGLEDVLAVGGYWFIAGGDCVGREDELAGNWLAGWEERLDVGGRRLWEEVRIFRRVVAEDIPVTSDSESELRSSCLILRWV
jgi:hypothetical protein